jgi:hypothetical protein
MSLSVDIQITGNAQKMLAKLDAKLVNRTELHHDIATRAENTVRDWLISLAGKRKNRFNAPSSDYFALAAASVGSESDATSATVNVTSPGITRAFSDITITPGNGKKYLTIPATAEAYNKRAATFNDLRLAFFKNGLLALVRPNKDAPKGERPPVYYWLKKSVFQKQDRTLLPSDKLLQSAAEEGASDWLKSSAQSDGY